MTLARRAFLRTVGVGSAAGLLAPRLFAHDSGPTLSYDGAVEVARFEIAPGTVTRFDSAAQIVDHSSWMFEVPDNADAGVLIEGLMAEDDANAIIDWANVHDGSVDGFADTSAPAAAMFRSGLVSSARVDDLAAKIISSVTQQRDVDLSLEFGADLADSDTGTRAPIILREALLDPARTGRISRIAPLAFPNFRWSQNFGDWKFQIRKSADDVHAFGTCVREPVNHFHVEVQRKDNRGKYEKITNYHIGTYRDAGRKRCFAVWENERNKKNKKVKDLCLRTCLPTYKDLQKQMKSMVVQAAAIAGVTIAAWLVIVIADTLAALLFGALVVL